MSFKDGDFLVVQLDEYDASTNNLIYTTDQEKAKQAGIHNQNTRYAPVNVVLGTNTVIKGLDRELHGMSLNEQKKFTLEPQDAFGYRDESLVRVVSLSDMRKRDIDPQPGMGLYIEGQRAIVRSVSSGRVVVDMNNPYADRTIICEVKVVKHITSEKERLQALVDDYQVKPEHVAVEAGKATITYGAATKKDADFSFEKALLVDAAFRYTNLEELDVVEKYTKKQMELGSKQQEHHDTE